MEYRDVLQNKIFSTEKMKKTGLFDRPYFFSDLYCFEPGQVQKPHTHHDSDKTYFVLEGRGTFKVGDEELVLGEHQLVLAPAGVEHGVSNRTDQQLVLLVTMAPNPNTEHSHS